MRRRFIYGRAMHRAIRCHREHPLVGQWSRAAWEAFVDRTLAQPGLMDAMRQFRDALMRLPPMDD